MNVMRVVYYAILLSLLILPFGIPVLVAVKIFIKKIRQ